MKEKYSRCRKHLLKRVTDCHEWVKDFSLAFILQTQVAHWVTLPFNFTLPEGFLICLSYRKIMMSVFIDWKTSMMNQGFRIYLCFRNPFVNECVMMIHLTDAWISVIHVFYSYYIFIYFKYRGGDHK